MLVDLQFFSYNSQGDTTYQKVIAFDSLANPGPDLGISQLDIDSIGNRHFWGWLFDWNQGSVRTFELELDSVGNTISNQYGPTWPWWSFSTNNEKLFSRLITKNNDAYYFILEDSLVSVSGGLNTIYVHKLKRQIIKKTLNGTAFWKLQWTEPDVTVNNAASQRLGQFISPIETAAGDIAFIRFDSTMVNGALLQMINSLGTTQFTVPVLSYVQTPGYDSYIGQIFATNDSCINVIGMRVLTSNQNVRNSFIIKINALGQLVDSASFGPIYIESAAQTTTGRIWVTYSAVSGTSIVGGIIELDNGFNLIQVHPQQSIERFSKIIKPNSIGGCHTGNFMSNYMYSNIYDVEMCNYDSLFNTYPNKLVGNIYQDNNKNCSSDPGDANLAWKSVSCTDAQNNSYYSYSNSSGQCSVRVPNGTFTLSHNPGAYKSTMCPNSNLAFTFNNANSLVTQNYFDTIIPNMNDLKISLFGDPFWIGNASYITAYYQNVGTKTVNATVKIVKDPAFTFSTSLPAANSSNGDSLFYNFTNIAPDSSGFISVNLVPSPNLISGTQLIFKTFVSNNFIDADPTNNLDSLTSMYYGSLKMASSSSVSSSNNINVNKPRYIYGNEDLIYKIRFQNTSGNLVKDILIIDTLSPYLDYSTFKIIGASQAYNFSIHSDGKLMVRFLNHNLQDSAANENQSKGYLVYTIRPRSDWSFTKKIHNQACIYFDYLHIVTTNQTINQKLDAVGIMENSNSKSYHFGVFPNPVKDEVIINCRNIVLSGDIRIYNTTGELIVSKIPEEKTGLIVLNLSTLANGLYILKTNSSVGPLTKKIIVQR